MSTVGGFGTKFYGVHDPKNDGSFITTTFFVIWSLPIFPIRSHRVLFEGEESGRDPYSNLRTHTARYQILEKLRINFRQVIQVYCGGYLILPMIFPIMILCPFFYGPISPEFFETGAWAMNLILVGLGLGFFGALLHGGVNKKVPYILLLLSAFNYGVATYAFPWIERPLDYSPLDSEEMETAIPGLIKIFNVDEHNDSRKLVIERLAYWGEPGVPGLQEIVNRNEVPNSLREMAIHSIVKIGRCEHDSTPVLLNYVRLRIASDLDGSTESAMFDYFKSMEERSVKKIIEGYDAKVNGSDKYSSEDARKKYHELLSRILKKIHQPALKEINKAIETKSVSPESLMQLERVAKFIKDFGPEKTVVR